MRLSILIKISFLLFLACGSSKVVDKRTESSQVVNPTGLFQQPGCCQFPLGRLPLQSMETGGRGFGAERAGGRKHAANDLLGEKGDPIFAVMDGEILDFHEFYLGTYAVVVQNSDGSVFRYGEVMALAEGLKVGSRVKAGETLASMGQPASSAMLHFEMFSGTQSGPLTQIDNAPYQRRGDLVDPTPHLNSWIHFLQ